MVGSEAATDPVGEATWESRTADDFEDPDTGEWVDMSEFYEHTVMWFDPARSRRYTQSVVQRKDVPSAMWAPTKRGMEVELLHRVEADLT